MVTEGMTASSRGYGVICPECGMVMYEIWRPPPVGRVVRCVSKYCGLLGQDFIVKDPEITLTPAPEVA